jgi:hypothetical protein
MWHVQNHVLVKDPLASAVLQLLQPKKLGLLLQELILGLQSIESTLHPRQHVSHR